MNVLPEIGKVLSNKRILDIIFENLIIRNLDTMIYIAVYIGLYECQRVKVRRRFV